MVIAYVAKFTSYTAVISQAAVKRVDQHLEEVALLAGVGFCKVFSGIVIKLTSRQSFIAFFVVFILSFSELSTGLLISPPGVETMSVKIYNLMHYGAEDAVAALCVIELATFLLLFFLAVNLLKNNSSECVNDLS